MGENLYTLLGAERDYEPLQILKIATPKGVYTVKEREEIYSSVKEQAGKHYLPIIVPEDVRLEIVSEI